MEGAIEAQQVYEQLMNEFNAGLQEGKLDNRDWMKKLKSQMDAEIAALPIRLPNPETGEVYSNEEAIASIREKYRNLALEKGKQFADEGARLTYISDYSNLIFDVVQLGAVLKPFSGLTRNVKVPLGVAERQAELLGKAAKPWYGKLGAMLNQAVVGSVIGQTIESIGTLLDKPDIIAGDYSMDNPVYNLGKSITDWAAEITPIYQTGDRFSDTGYWFQGLTSAASAASFLLPGWGITKVLQLGAKVLKLGTTGSKLLQIGVGAIGMRHMEGAIEAEQVHEQLMNQFNIGLQEGKFDNTDWMKELKANMDAEIAALPIRLPNPETGEVYSNEEAIASIREKYRNLVLEKGKQFANDGAKLTYIADYSNLIFDVIQLGAILKPFSRLTRNIKAPLAVAERQAELLGKAAKPWYGKLGYRMLDASKIGLVESTEGIEEGVNYIASQEGQRHGEIQMGLREDDGTEFGDRLSGYVGDEEFTDSFIFGAIGGVGFKALGNTEQEMDNKIDKIAEEYAPIFEKQTTYGIDPNESKTSKQYVKEAIYRLAGSKTGRQYMADRNFNPNGGGSPNTPSDINPVFSTFEAPLPLTEKSSIITEYKKNKELFNKINTNKGKLEILYSVKDITFALQQKVTPGAIGTSLMYLDDKDKVQFNNWIEAAMLEEPEKVGKFVIKDKEGNYTFGANKAAGSVYIGNLLYNMSNNENNYLDKVTAKYNKAKQEFEKEYKPMMDYIMKNTGVTEDVAMQKIQEFENLLKFGKTFSFNDKSIVPIIKTNILSRSGEAAEIYEVKENGEVSDKPKKAKDELSNKSKVGDIINVEVDPTQGHNIVTGKQIGRAHV